MIFPIKYYFTTWRTPFEVRSAGSQTKKCYLVNDIPPPNIAKNNYQVFGRVLTYIIDL